MVLKKPYGILIKHFKLIHLILAILMSYVTLKIKDIYDFFNEYIKLSWTSINMDEVSSYINVTNYISIVLILLILVIIFLLMNFKKKQNLYYKIAIPAYVLSFIVHFISARILRSAVTEIISPLNLRIYRDVNLIMFIIQAVLLIVPILRGIGFDVKKFNFKKDIADLQIDDLDSEEVEVNLSFDKHKFKRKLNRFGRTSSYIILRNKILIFRILLIFIIVSLGYFSLNVLVINKVYKENIIVKLDKYSFKINKSYLTMYDSNNNIISNNYKYLVVNFTVINKIEDNTFNLDKVDIKIGDKYYFPDATMYSDFIDLGYGYSNQKLGVENNLEYIMVFKIPKNEKTNRVLLRYISDIEYKDGNYINKYKTFKLDINDDTNKILNINKNINDIITINSNIFKISNYQIANSFNYTYQECQENVCNDIIKSINSTNNLYKILKLTGEFKLENKGIAKSYSDYANYYEKMFYIQYTLNDISKKAINIRNITPTKIINNSNQIYLEIPSEIIDSSNINLHLKTRNTDYNIKLK